VECWRNRYRWRAGSAESSEAPSWEFELDEGCEVAGGVGVSNVFRLAFFVLCSCYKTSAKMDRVEREWRNMISAMLLGKRG